MQAYPGLYPWVMEQFLVSEYEALINHLNGPAEPYGELPAGWENLPED